MTIITDSKKCTKCGEVRLLGQFNANRKTKSGYDSWCKQCRREYMRSYWHNGAPAVEPQRQCIRCGEIKPLASFRRRKRKQCRDCDNAIYRQYMKGYTERNRERMRLHRLQRRPVLRVRWQNYAASKRTRGRFTHKEWQALCDWFGNACLRCGATGVLLTIDHVAPVSKGGANTIDNLQPLCKSCNSSKCAKYVDYREPARLAAFLAWLHSA